MTTATETPSTEATPPVSKEPTAPSVDELTAQLESKRDELSAAQANLTAIARGEVRGDVVRAAGAVTELDKAVKRLEDQTVTPRRTAMVATITAALKMYLASEQFVAAQAMGIRGFTVNAGLDGVEPTITVNGGTRVSSGPSKMAGKPRNIKQWSGEALNDQGVNTREMLYALCSKSKTRKVSRADIDSMTGAQRQALQVLYAKEFGLTSTDIPAKGA